MNDYQQRGKKCQPFAPPLSLLLFALVHDSRVKSQSGIISKVTSIHLADIDLRHALLRYQIYG